MYDDPRSDDVLGRLIARGDWGQTLTAPDPTHVVLRARRRRRQRQAIVVAGAGLACAGVVVLGTMNWSSPHFPVATSPSSPATSTTPPPAAQARPCSNRQLFMPGGDRGRSDGLVTQTAVVENIGRAACRLRLPRLGIANPDGSGLVEARVVLTDAGPRLLPAGRELVLTLTAPPAHASAPSVPVRPHWS